MNYWMKSGGYFHQKSYEYYPTLQQYHLEDIELAFVCLKKWMSMEDIVKGG